MAALELSAKPNGSVSDPEQLSDKVEQDLKESFQEAECSSKHDKTEATCWNYCIPFPGVKYYSYEKWPTQVEVPVDDGHEPDFI